MQNLSEELKLTIAFIKDKIQENDALLGLPWLERPWIWRNHCVFMNMYVDVHLDVCQLLKWQLLPQIKWELNSQFIKSKVLLAINYIDILFYKVDRRDLWLLKGKYMQLIHLKADVNTAIFIVC